MKCIYCHNSISLFLHKNNYDIYRCTSCGLAITDLHENYESFVKRLYDEQYFTGGRERNAYADYQRDKPYIVKNFQKFLIAIQKERLTGKLLDVGCATGFFVELALSHGYDAYGIDPSAFAAQKARELVGKKRISVGTLDTLQIPPHSYDIITLFDVFEHLNNPLETLTRIKKLLRPNGILVIATGNTASLWAKVLKKHWTFYIPPQHLYFFSQPLLLRILSDHGYTVLSTGKIGKWLSFEYVMHLAETAAQFPLASQARKITSAFKIEKMPVYLPVGDNMVVIAKKEASR